MSITFQTNDEKVSWAQVTALLRHFGLTDQPEEQIRKAFQNSFAVVFARDEAGNTVACGRAISDGVMQGMIFNIALDEAYHHQGLGREIIRRLVEQLKGMVITLYTHPKTLRWYEDLGFSRMNTALVRFRDKELHKMLEMKFIDRYETNIGVFQEESEGTFGDGI